MATTEEKYCLVMEAARLCMKQEFRGNLLADHLPVISLVVEKDPDESGGIDTITRIRAKYPTGKTGYTANWDGMGKSLDEALTSNLWGLEFEIEARLKQYQEMLARLKEAAPDDSNEK